MQIYLNFVRNRLIENAGAEIIIARGPATQKQVAKVACSSQQLAVEAVGSGAGTA